MSPFEKAQLVAKLLQELHTSDMFANFNWGHFLPKGIVLTTTEKAQGLTGRALFAVRAGKYAETVAQRIPAASDFAGIRVHVVPVASWPPMAAIPVTHEGGKRLLRRGVRRYR